ncbi:MAG: ABC transporter ATP-binding protein [Pseudomonadota bacterium]
MIQVSDLSFRYPKAPTPTLKNLTFEVEPGQILGFVGPSGAGKSTTQRVLTGQLATADGRVDILGRPVADWGRELYRYIGVAFELPTHFLRLTGRENLEFFQALYGVSDQRWRSHLEELGLADASEQRVGSYSKGMMTRLGLVRALLHDPKVLFLDEPGGGLDPASVAKVEDIIRRERDAGKTIFLTTHDMLSVDRLCDRVAFLIDGTIAVVDEPGRLKRQHGRAELTVTFGEADAPSVESFALDGLAENARFQEVIKTQALQTMHTEEASLSEIFRKLTGASLV